MIKIKVNKKKIGAEIVCNLNKINKKDLNLIRSTLHSYGLVYFRKQNLSSISYINFAKKFGKLADYPMLKGLSKKYPQITVVERKVTDKGPSFGEQFHTDSSYTKKPPRYTMLLSKIVPPKGKANTEFSSQYLAYENLPKKFKIKINKAKALFSSLGPISVTRLEREKEKGKNKKKEIKSIHNLVRAIGKKKSIYCSPGHVVKILRVNQNEEKNIKSFLFKHQLKKKFQYSLQWEKNQLAIWDNRSMLHQATPFKGRRIMHRITIH